MFKQNLAFLYRIPALALLVMLSVSMVATCPVKSLVFDVETVRTNMKAQPKPMDRSGSTISCAADNAVIEASWLDIRKPGSQQLIPFLLFAALLFYTDRIARLLKPPFARDNDRKTTPVPLFLSNGSWRL